MTTLKNTNGLNVYKKIEKTRNLTNNPYEIVKILLDDLSRIMHLLILEIDKKNAFLISKQRQNHKHTQKSISKYVTRSLTTIYSLQNSLDFDKGGSISINLFQLYEFCRCQIIKSFTNNENKKLKKAYDALNIIIGAWQEIKIK